MHRLLKRQLKKHLNNTDTPAEIKQLLEDINASYQNFDEDYKRLERILELSSQELFKTNNLLNNEKDKIKEELAESYKKLNEFDKAVDSSFSVSYTTTDGIITDVNSKFCETSGYTKKELIGKPHSIISSNYHTETFWKNLWETLNKGEIWYGDIKNRTKKGEEYWEATNIIPFYNSQGNVYQYMAIKTDITQKKLAEAQIKKLDLIAEKTLNIVITTDAKGIATWANEGFERITGFTVKELIGKKPGELLQGKKTSKKTIKEMRLAIKNGEPFNGEIYNYSKSGRGYWLSINITPLKDDDGNLTGFIAIENDVTDKKEFEEELRISEERWKYALSGGHDGIWDWDIDKNELFVSETWQEMFGYTNPNRQPQFPGLWEFIHPEDRKRAKEIFDNYVKGKINNYQNEYRILCANGTYKHILDRGKIIESEEDNGTIKRRFIGTHTDVTPLKEAEAQAQMSEIIIENSPTLLIRWTPNFKLNVEYISENIKVYGYNAQEWVANNVAFTHFVHPDDVKPVTRKVLQSFRDKIERVQLRFRLRDSQGGFHWIDSENKIVWDNDENRAAYFQGVLTDITDQIEAEEKLKESENRFRSLVQNSTDITTILNHEGKTIYESPSFYRTFGYKEKDVIGKSIFDFIHPNDIETAYAEFFKGLDRGGISDPVEFRIKHKNNSWLYVESIGNNLLHVPGIAGIVINSRDITDRKEAEQKSKKLQEFYEVILNKIPTDIVVFDEKHRYMFANETAIKDPEKRAFIIGKDDYDYCEKYGKNKALAHSRRAIFNKVAYKKEQIEFEEPIETLNGTVWVLRRMFPLLNDKNELTNMIGFGLDITERKAAEKRLQDSQERLTLATQAAQLGIWDWDLVTQNLLWDKEMYPLFDIDRDDFSGDYDAFEKTLHPDDKQRVFDSVQATITGKQGDFKDTFRIITKNNEVKYIAAISKLFRQEKTNNPVRMIGVNFDVTESTLAEQKILKSQSELQEAQHIARIGSWEIDMRTHSVTWSDEMYTIQGLENSFVPTLNNVHTFYTEETREEIVEAFKNAIHNKIPFDIQSQIITKAGKTLDVRTKGIPVIEEGRVPYVRGIFQDITQQKEAERQLKEYTNELESINKELDQFAYIVSHDLKAPLRAINNLSMWIEEDLEEVLEGDTKHQFNLLRGRVSRLEDLINGILNYSRAGRITVNPSTVNIRTLIDGIIEMLAPPEEYKISIPAKLPTLTTEKIALEQIFANFISNAIKYNKNPKPTIKITCKDAGKFYKFGIADNGDGIEPQYHEKIFVIFQTLEARDKVESTGVGLAIVKKIIEEKGGEVWVDSAKGKGSTFYFTWPKE
jgi:PAS domain S-box-containing protein